MIGILLSKIQNRRVLGDFSEGETMKIKMSFQEFDTMLASLEVCKSVKNIYEAGMMHVFTFIDDSSIEFWVNLDNVLVRIVDSNERTIAYANVY